MAETIALFDYETERGKPMPSFNHSAIQSNLIMGLTPFRKKFRVTSELNLELSNWPSVPDLSIYPKRPLDLNNDTIAMSEPPLCVVEIISPGQSLNELVSKARNYFKHGVQSCWIVLPPLGNIYVFTAPNVYQIFKSDETLYDPILDLSIPLEEVFE